MAHQRDSAGDVPVVVGAVAGAVSWTLGYIATYLLTSSSIQGSILRQFTDIPTWKIVGWVFYNAHAVPTVFEGFFGGTASFVGGEDGFTSVLYLVPVLLLFGAGFVTGRVGDAERKDPANAALAGVTVVIGYGVLSVAGGFFFATESVHPDFVLSVALPSLLYPLVFGGVGASLARLS